MGDGDGEKKDDCDLLYYKSRYFNRFVSFPKREWSECEPLSTAHQQLFGNFMWLLYFVFSVI